MEKVGHCNYIFYNKFFYNKLFKFLRKIDYEFSKYYFNTEYSYSSENSLSKIDYDMPLVQTKVVGVYQKVIEYNEDDYNEILEKLKFKNQELPKVDFNKQSVVITVLRYEIQEIKQSIGNIKYELG